MAVLTTKPSEPLEKHLRLITATLGLLIKKSWSQGNNSPAVWEGEQRWFH